MRKILSSVRFNNGKEAGELEIIRREDFVIVIEYKSSSDRENYEENGQELHGRKGAEARAPGVLSAISRRVHHSLAMGLAGLW